MFRFLNTFMITFKQFLEGRSSDYDWHMQHITSDGVSKHSSDPRKYFKNRVEWLNAAGRLGSVSNGTATDKAGRVVGKWNPDKMEGWVEPRD